MYQASVENRGDSRYYATTPNSSLVLDTNGQGPNPIDTMLASLAACVAHHILYWLRDRNINNPGFTVAASGELSEDRLRLSAISVVAGIGHIARDSEQRRELMEYIQRCPIYGTLSIGCPTNFSFTERL